MTGERMITVEMLCHRIVGLQPQELESWIGHAWVRPQGQPGAWLFQEIDVARVELIVEMRRELDLDEDAMPVVLSLLDQLYAERRRARLLCDAILREAPEDVRGRILAALAGEERKA